MGKKRELRLPSHQNQIYRVEHFVEEISDEFHLNDSYFGNIMIAVTEAVENAILHGHGQDPEKLIHIEAEVKPEGLIITVKDEGGGFDFRKYEDINALLSMEGEAKGISLMSSVTDDIKFKEKGTRVEMLFKITGIESETYEKRYRSLQSYHREKSEGTDKVDEKRERDDEAEH
jgi:serine/threonine-protein kinase RsbW